MLLEGFRSFEQTTTLPLAPLTILAGPNNVGKSSVIQALLAFVQSEQMQNGDSLLLSGAWCDLGAFDQVVSAGLPADQQLFSIGLTGTTLFADTVDSLWSFGPSPDPTSPSATILGVAYSADDSTGRVTRTPDGFVWAINETVNAQTERRSEALARFEHPGRIFGVSDRMLSEFLTPLDSGRTQYVGPYRAPPQPLYTPRTSNVGPPLGRYGEHTAELLFRNRTQRTDVLAPDAPSQDPQPLLSAVNAWWSHIFAGSLALQIDAPARLGFTLAIDTPSAERLGLGQVGLGLSQALPIVAASLVSKPGDLILVDTPEAHLHPGAQHRLADLFLALARSGRQVIVETHSEHIVNAARLAVKAGMPRDDVSILFFEQEDGRTVVQSIELDDHGRALRWPAGFFDQAAKDLADLLR
ncbi:AAA family ATPase [Polyangium aurulentum]|uniref:AAA family ATPase n=1 Tax=Polyangium aurulentum TaxID=2567896 RepID=UPI0010AECFD7|nr:DUF3696 domain-containing protein [Polyangium aurulentum]UQA62969.1 DUF3696 domain-containing protein [Polyangium aurulentum]